MKLKKNLNTVDVFALSTGAMFSSGLFLLPGLAAAQTGQSVILAYLVAGVLMIPPMLSQAELATAMPKAGGTYYFLDRAIGPLMGTIGGLGTWISLVFKSAFALLGMGAYVGLFVKTPIVAIALLLAVVFMFLNLVGAKETTGLQRVLVGVLIVVVGFFVLAAGASVVVTAAPTTSMPFLLNGAEGFAATVGLVFVSYAGLTKVASVAEEVENPDRAIPRGMFVSLFVATLAYSSAVAAITYLIPAEQLYTDLAPMATAAAALAPSAWSSVALALVSIAAFAAFASTANAGILSASRYPLAMARDRLLPGLFGRVNASGVPRWGIILSGGSIALCIVAFDVAMVAKLASAFQLALFGLLNVAVIVMRESGLQHYKPGFRSPFYPYVQIVGILIPIALISQLGWMAWAFTGGLIAIGALWFLLYGAPRVQRSGAILHMFERLGRGKFAPLDDELRSLLAAKEAPTVEAAAE